jgi:hypothetical protein
MDLQKPIIHFPLSLHLLFQTVCRAREDHETPALSVARALVAEQGSNRSAGELADVSHRLAILVEAARHRSESAEHLVSIFVDACVQSNRVFQAVEQLTMDLEEPRRQTLQTQRDRASAGVKHWLSLLGVEAVVIRDDPRAPVVSVEFDPDLAKGPVGDYRYYLC